MDRAGKAQLRGTLAEKFNKSKAVIVAEYRGLTVEEVTNLRVQLREASAEFRVIKNRIAKKAIEDEAQGLSNISDKLVGPVGLVCAYGDGAQATKAVLEFCKGHPNLKITAGQVDGAVLNSEELKAIADLPSKEVLLGQIVGSIVAPHRGLLGVLNGVSRNLVQVLNAIKDKKS